MGTPPHQVLVDQFSVCSRAGLTELERSLQTRNLHLEADDPLQLWARLCEGELQGPGSLLLALHARDEAEQQVIQAPLLLEKARSSIGMQPPRNPRWEFRHVLAAHTRTG